MKISVVKKLAKLLVIPLFVSAAAYGAQAVKIMPLGDSITYGNDYYNVPDETTQVSYRKHLWEDLGAAGYTVDFIGDQSGGTNFDPPFDSDHQGHPGFTAAEIAGDVYSDLQVNEPEVVLLHIGTNELRTDTADIELALNEIDRYENDKNVHIQVILARIINRWVGWDDPDNTNRTTPQHVTDTTTFNLNLQTMADARIAAGDDIIVVDMETDSGINYDATDMTDDLHPNDSGYAKMASVWYSALTSALPTHLWKLDEATGATSYLDTYRDNDGTCIGAGCPTAVSGQIGGAQLFDGNDEVTVSDDGTFDWSGNDSFTIEFWVKPTRTDGVNQVVVGRENEAKDNYFWWAGIIGTDGHIAFRLRDSNGNQNSLDGPVLNNGDWYHVACVRDGENNINLLYVNGQLSDSSSVTYAGNFVGTTPANIGYLTYQGGNTFHLDSAIDELSVYNGAVNAAQVKLHYQNGLNAPTLSITSTPNTFAQVGVSYLYNVESNVPAVYTYIADPDPAWMNIDTDTGEITGTPTVDTVGNIDMAVEAIGGGQTATQEYVLRVRNPANLPVGMSHYWKLDELEMTTTRTYLDSYSAADGTCTGTDCPTPLQGMVDGAQSFDGTKKIDVIDTANFEWMGSQSFSIEYWMQIEQIPTDYAIQIGRDSSSTTYSWWSGIEIDTGHAIFSLRDDNNIIGRVIGTTPLADNGGNNPDHNGHHIAIVKDGNTLRLYVDGILEHNVTTAYTGDFTDSSNPTVNIGYLNNNNTPAFFYTGVLDDLAVFQTALSQTEINEHYQNGLLGDTTPPEITLTGANPQVINAGSAYTELGATASDNVDGDISANIVIDASAVDTNTPGSYSVTYNVSDAAGNAADQVSRTVNVVDTTPPEITLTGANPQTISVGDAYVELGATASDNVDGDISANIVIDASAVDTNTPDSYNVTYNVSDAAGNAATQVTRTVNVVDNTPPEITLTGANPQTISVGDAYVELGATASDNVDGDISANIVIDASAVDTSTVGSYSVTYNVSDAAGNAADQVSRTVNVVDTTPPEITLTGANPQTISVGDAYVELGATASDNVDGDISANIVIDASAVDTNAYGQYIVTYNVSDSSGNAAVEVSRTVNVVAAPDTTPPVITLTGANPQIINAGSAYTELGASAQDDRDGNISANIVIDASAVDTSTVGSYSVTYNVSDAAGNAAVQVTRTVDIVAAPPEDDWYTVSPDGNTYTAKNGNSTVEVNASLFDIVVTTDMITFKKDCLYIELKSTGEIRTSYISGCGDEEGPTVESWFAPGTKVIAKADGSVIIETPLTDDLVFGGK